MQKVISQQDMQLQMIDGTVLNFRFSVGTARIVRDLTGSDPMKEEAATWYDTASILFVAAYFSSCKAYKKQPEFTREQLVDYFDEIDVPTAQLFIQGFNKAMTVVASPEAVQAVKEAEKPDKSEEPVHEPSVGSPNR